MTYRLGLSISALCVVAIGSMAAAQTPPPVSPEAMASVRAACMSSIMSLCSAEAMSGDRPAVRACLIKNLDKTAPECQAAVKATAQSVQH